MIKLNPDQRAAVDETHKFIDGPEMFFNLEGGAGTGKSTSVQTTVRETRAKIILTAPTNKATKVLRQMAEEELDGAVDTATIYSTLGLRLDNNGELKEIVAAEDANRAGNYDVVVVDEGSMINRNLFKHIRRTAVEENVKFLFMGDKAQLPPINEEYSEIFGLAYKRSLTKVERHDNQILTLANHLRDCQFAGAQLNLASNHGEDGGVYKLNYKKLREKACEAFTSDNYLANPGSIKLIAWRNATVNVYNELIREAMYGAKIAAEAPFQIGERVVVCQPIMSADRSETVMTTDEEGTVETIDVVQHPIYQGLTCYKIEVDPEFGEGWVTCYVIHPRSAKDHAAMLGDLANKAKDGRGRWPAFWDCKESIHDVRPCHAITAHRAQGSTYESVFVDAGDIMVNRRPLERLQCLYVACSRPSRVLVIC
jgi:exodeoxyribonuclease-5